MKALPLLALALLSQSLPALANPVVLPHSQVVQTADLNLSTSADQARLDNRIRIAINKVCGEASAIDLRGQNLVQRCRDETRRNARSQYDTAIAAAQRGVVVASVK